MSSQDVPAPADIRPADEARWLRKPGGSGSECADDLGGGAGRKGHVAGMDGMRPHIALVGDRSPAHTRIPLILDALREREGLDLDACWIRTDEVAELPGHPFYLVTLFQPEPAERQPHPLVRAFAAAAADRAALSRGPDPVRL